MEYINGCPYFVKYKNKRGTVKTERGKMFSEDKDSIILLLFDDRGYLKIFKKDLTFIRIL